MNLRASWSLLACACITFVSCAPDRNIPPVEPAASPAFRQFVDDYFKAYFEFNPSQATGDGFHEYDSKLEDFSAPAIDGRVAALRSLATRLAALQHDKLAAEESVDAEILDGQIKSELQDIEVLQTWHKNPMGYVGVPGGAIDVLMKRDFAPAQDRLRSIVARMQGIPKFLQSLKQNVAEPPKEFTDLAIRMAQGSVGFFKDSVATWAKTADGGDKKLKKDFDAANQAVVKALEETTRYLKKDVLPKSKGSYAIGAKNFSDKLAYDDMIDIPLDRLLAIGQANLDKDYNDFIETSKLIDPTKSPAVVMKMITNDHPTENNLIPTAKNTLESIRQFIVDHKIVTIPSEVRPIVTETPPYARSGTFASMDTPGPYERKAKEAFYYVTPVEKDWTPQHKDEHLRGYSRPVLDMISIHEAYPGHFVQFLYVSKFPTKTRKLTFCSSNVEGWAHYCEQMMVEQGFGNSDPKIKLAQLSEALLRDCRYVVGIKLHTQGMRVDDGAKVFVDKAFMEPANAYEEARRGAYNPTYLYYTLGKLQIYKLRDDYKRAKGEAFSLETFHNEFVKQGGIPLKLMRQILLPGDTQPTL
jgi:uncharacterized protein (DUF885 family)